MHRVDTPGNVANRFSPGNPSAGQRATQLGADWHNDVQEELISILSAAGIAPVKGDWDQVLTAMQALFLAKAGGLVNGNLFVGDVNYYLSLAGGTPYLNWDNTDYTLYDRGTNSLNDYIDNVLQRWVTSNGIVHARVGFDAGGNLVYHAGNDGAGSPVDAGLFAGQLPAYYIDIVARLGFTPVQQGTGVGQLSNTVKIGWSGTRITATVDASDMGNLTTDNLLAAGVLIANGLAMRRGGVDLYGPDNDGAGSGNDADLWRGQTPQQFVDSQFTRGANGNGKWRRRPIGGGDFETEQRGVKAGPYTGEQVVAITFPVPYASSPAVEDIQAETYIASSDLFGDLFAQVITSTISNTGFSVQLQQSGGTPHTVEGVRWSCVSAS